MQNNKKVWLPQILTILLLLGAFNPSNPYGYYIFLRWVCFLTFAYLTIVHLEMENKNWIWAFGFTAFIYNPIFRIHLTRDLWSFINIGTIILIVLSAIFLKQADGKTED